MKISSILLSKLRGLVDTSCPVNLNIEISLANNLWSTMEYFSFNNFASSFEICWFNKFSISSSWNLLDFSLLLIVPRSLKEERIDLKHCWLVLGKEVATVVNKSTYYLVVRSNFKISIYFKRSEINLSWLLGVTINLEELAKTLKYFTFYYILRKSLWSLLTMKSSKTLRAKN